MFVPSGIFESKSAGLVAAEKQQLVILTLLLWHLIQCVYDQCHCSWVSWTLYIIFCVDVYQVRKNPPQFIAYVQHHFHNVSQREHNMAFLTSIIICGTKKYNSLMPTCDALHLYNFTPHKYRATLTHGMSLFSEWCRVKTGKGILYRKAAL